jgi:hypothetical protein
VNAQVDFVYKILYTKSRGVYKSALQGVRMQGKVVKRRGENKRAGRMVSDNREKGVASCLLVHEYRERGKTTGGL